MEPSATHGGSQKRNVLIIEISESDGGRLRNEFKDAGWDASFVQPTQPLADLPVPFVPGVIVVDPSAARDGRGPIGCPEAVHQLRIRFPEARIVVATNSPSLVGSFDSARLGARAYLAKPTTAEIIIASVEDHQSVDAPDSPPTAIRSLARNEWEYLEWVMAMCGNNKSRAARMLGIPRGSLQRKLAKRPPSR
jgi:two-component system response regulator RegA